MNVVQMFLTWLASYHGTWLVLKDVGSDQLKIVYGGNFVDAYNYAQAVGGFISQVISG